MATELDRNTSLQTLADSTGLIYDRAVQPEKVIGQAWLISRGRVVTLASAVSNYADAPWALMIKFPHPNLAYAVRTVTLHPDFNKREARDYYLAQSRGPVPPPSFDNDIATLALDSDLTVPEPEKIAELNRALALPFDISAQDMSGSMRSGEAMQILNSALSTGRNGLLTMVDQRNMPFARISVRQTRIVRAQFENLHNEIAMCELIWRKPAGNFAFQPSDTYRWPADVPEISTPTDNIIAEAMRRAEELPRVIEMLGGPDTRFGKITKLADFSSIQQSDRWVAERVWEVLDGYLPISKIAERAGTDTYSTIKMIWDLATMGLITLNTQQPFHSNGQLGPLLLPAPELDLTTWDPLTAMYIDPISFGPQSINGNFFGSAHIINNKTLLHTATIPPSVQAAAVFKDGKLVAIHSGAANIRGANMPPIALQRMVWIGALNELGTKRLRTTEAAVDSAELEEQMAIDPQATSQRLSTLRNRPLTAETSKTVVPQGLPEEETGPLAKFSKTQIAAAGGVMFAIGLVMMLGSMMAPKGAPPAATTPVEQATTTSTTTTTAATTDATKTATAATTVDPKDEELFGDMKAKELAEKLSPFRGYPPSTFKYVDTSKLTEPRESFGLTSEPKNTEITFVYWPNIAPVANIGVVNKSAPAYGGALIDKKVDYKGNTAHTNWTAGRYWDSKGKINTYVVGTAPSQDPARTIVWIAKGHTPDTTLPDIYFPAQVIEQMLNNKNLPKANDVAAATGAATPAGAQTTALATPEQLADYRKKLAATIKANYKQPKVEEDQDTKVGMELSLDSTGNVSGMTVTPNPDDSINKAFQKAIDSSKPFPAPPAVKGGKLDLFVQAENGSITVDER